MLRALLLGTARGMERVGEQQETGNQVWFFGAEHAGLASAVGMAAEKNAGLFLLVRAKIPTSLRVREKWGAQTVFQRSDRVFQAGTIAGGVAGAGWAEGSCLAVGQIAAEDGI